MAGVFESISCFGRRCLRKMSQSPVKEALAEFFGTFVLVVLGDGVMANCVLGRLNLNSVIVGALGWGLAVMTAVAVAGGVSGGHVNPAVTIGLSSIKKCPLKHMVPYFIAQYVGSFLAATVVYLVYTDAMNLYDGGVRQIPPSLNSTAEIFATYPKDFASSATCFLDQVVATALLLIVICTATDSKNLGVPKFFQPLVIGFGISAVILAFGNNCGAPLNPARDFAPRLFTAMSGWGEGVFSYRNYEWFWIPVIAPHVGGLIGAWLYKLLIEMPLEDRNCTAERIGLTVTIPEENTIYKHVMDKIARDAKLAADARHAGSNQVEQDVDAKLDADSSLGDSSIVKEDLNAKLAADARLASSQVTQNVDTKLPFARLGGSSQVNLDV